MSANKSHRYQSSREVFQQYIPGYKEQLYVEEVLDRNSEASQGGLELAEGLVEKFKASLTKTLR